MRFIALASFLVASVLSLSAQALTWHCSDFSSLANLEASGRTYKDGGVTKPLEAILASHGQNLARIRVWTSTSNSQYSLAYGLALAKRAKAAGMSIYVDLHYSDTWADPGHQAIPSGWPTDLNGLNTKIFTYTASLVSSFANQGTPISIISIGNEINDGFLWPTGRISVNGYSPLSQMLHSAINGVRSVSTSVRTMVHLANGWNTSGVSSFYKQIFIPGQLALTDVDIMGFSFYPFYETTATLANLKTSLTGIVNSYGKDVIVAETDWPATGSCHGATLTENIPISAAGQQTWVGDIRTVVQALPSGHGIGICYWEPAWIGNAGLGSSCDDNLLVDGSGNTRTSIAMFSANM